jgi:hypothetical protein
VDGDTVFDAASCPGRRQRGRDHVDVVTAARERDREVADVTFLTTDVGRVELSEL